MRSPDEEEMPNHGAFALSDISEETIIQFARRSEPNSASETQQLKPYYPIF